MKTFNMLKALIPCSMIFLAVGCNLEASVVEGQFIEASPPRVVFDDDAAAWGTDAFTFVSSKIVGDTLTANVTYRGGCQGHDFVLVVSPEFSSDIWPEANVTLAHNANGDSCDQLVTDVIKFGLAPIETRARSEFEMESGLVGLQYINGPADRDHWWFGFGGRVLLNC